MVVVVCVEGGAGGAVAGLLKKAWSSGRRRNLEPKNLKFYQHQRHFCKSLLKCSIIPHLGFMASPLLLNLFFLTFS